MRSRATVAALASLVGTFSGETAYAIDKHACVVASDRGQAVRIDGKLVEAREAFVACADSSCPALVRTACADWLTEVDKLVPSVLFSVRDPEGRDVVDARVDADGKPLAGAMEGRPVLLDPGPHTFHFAAPGARAVDQAVVLREGEQRRTIEIVLERPAAITPVLPLPVSEPSSSPRTAAWGFTVAAAAAWTVFGIFAVDGHVAYENAKGSCGSGCESAYGPINTKFDVADVSLGVAVALTGVATVLFLTHHGPSAKPSSATRPLGLTF
jgi:hypothetical protein